MFAEAVRSVPMGGGGKTQTSSRRPEASVGDGARHTILVVDGVPGDEPAIREAARLVDLGGTRLLVLLVPAMVLDWAHLEFGDDPNQVRLEIEWEQWRATTRMLDQAGVAPGYRMRRLRSRWTVPELADGPDRCESLIVSTSSRFVRRRLSTLARRGRIDLRLVR
jgi:hypothetical protein